MTPVEELINDIKHPQFQALPPTSQVNVVGQHLRRLYGEQYANLTPDKQQEMINYTLGEYLPKTTTEKVLDWVPLAAPLISQYYYGRNVKASPTVEKIIGAETSEKYGALINVAEDVVLTAGAVAALFYAAPTILAGTALEGIWVVGNAFLREAAIGGLYEVGKLATNPPSSGGEAVGRIAGGAALFGVGGAAFEGIGAGFRGRLGEFFGPTSSKINNQRLAKEFSLLYPDDPRMAAQAQREFGERVVAGTSTEDDLRIMLGVAGNRNSPAAQAMRYNAERGLREIEDNRRLRSETSYAVAEQNAATSQRLYEQRTLAEQQEINIAERERRAVEQQNQEFRARQERGYAEESARDYGLRAAADRENRLPPTPQFESLAFEMDEAQRLASNAARARERGVADMRAEQLEREQAGGRAEIRESQRLTRERLVTRRVVEEETERDIATREAAAIAEQNRQLQREKIDIEVRASEARRTERVAAQRESDIRYREYQAAQLQEQNRREAADEAIEAIQRGSRETGSPNATVTESMLMEVHRDPGMPRAGFVGDQPVTLPMGMMTDQGPVIVERFNAGQAILRGGKGMVARTAIREPRTPAESAALRELVQREGISPPPGRQETISILESRVAADRAGRQADVHKLRPDFATNTVAQTQEFNLRRGAAEALLQATNREFSESVTTSLSRVRPLAGERIVGSIEKIPNYVEATDVMQAIGGSGFENVKTAVNPQGHAEITFTRGTSELENRVAQLNHIQATHRNIVDPTNRTYNGLTVEEHTQLGKAFGLTDKEIKRYTSFVEQTLDDMSSRGIRVPADIEVLGIEALEVQAAGKARRAQSIRPDAVVDAERMQRFQTGDWLTFDFEGKKVTGQVESMLPHRRAAEPPIPLIRSEDGQLLQPFTQEQLRAAGAQREVSMPIGRDPEAALNIHSPARTLEALVNPTTRSVPLEPVLPNPTALNRGGAEVGLTVGVNRYNGTVTVALKGNKITFSGASSMEDAAEFVNGMRALRKERENLLQMFGGRECLR